MGEIRDNIKKNLGYYLTLRGMSQKELAEKLGVSQSSVTCWVKGKNSPDIEVVAQICDVLDISVIDLFGAKGPQNKKNPPSPTEEGKGEQELPPNIANQKDAYLVRIKAAMEARGVDAAYLARELNISTDDMTTVLESDHNPPRPLLYPIARILKVKVTYLMGYPVKMDRVYYSEDGERLSESDIDWIDFIRLCQDEQAKHNALTAASAFLDIK